MKRITSFLFVFLFVSSILYAQSDFRSGYIIMNNNDTIHGLIDYKGSLTNSKKCTFKVSDNAEKQVFTPNDIKSYRYTDSKFYISRSLKSNDEEKQIFVEYLIDGIVDMFYYRDAEGNHYLTENEAGELFELPNKEAEFIKNGNKYRRNSKMYIGMLRAVFKDSPKIARKIENIGLNHKSIIKVTNDYHNEVCPGEECIIYEKNLPNVNRSFGFIIGINAISISDNGNFDDDLYFMRKNEFETIIYPSVGFYYKVNLPFENEKLHFQYEATFSQFKLKSKSNFNYNPILISNINNNISLTLNSFNNDFIFKHQFHGKKIKQTLGFGGFLNYFFKSDYKRVENKKYSWKNENTIEESSENPFSKLDFGFSLGFGFITRTNKQKEISANFRFKKGLGYMKSLNSNYLTFSIGYQLGK